MKDFLNLLLNVSKGVSMLRLKHALPLALLVSVSVFAMEKPKMTALAGYHYQDSKTGEMCVAGEVPYEDADGKLLLADAPKGKVVFATDAKGQILKDKKGIVLAKKTTEAKPVLEVSWQKNPNFNEETKKAYLTLTVEERAVVSTPAPKSIFVEGTEASKSLTKEERPVVLLSTTAISNRFTTEQSTLNRLQQEEDAAIKAKKAQLDTLKAFSIDLWHKLGGKQVAVAGTELNIRYINQQISQLEALKDAQIATQKQTAADIETLNASINKTAQQVAAAEAANKKSWWTWTSKSTATPIPVVTPAAAESASTEDTTLSQPAQEDDLLSTIALSKNHTTAQSTFKKLQQDEEAATKAKEAQLDTLKASATNLSRKLTEKKDAENVSKLKITNYEKQITKLKALKEAEIVIQQQTASDIETLKATIKQTPQDVAAAEAAKKAADAANKTSWWSLRSKATVAPVATAAPAAEAATPAAAETTATK